MLRIVLAMFCVAATTTCGCTSFRTTALYRFDNDSVAPETRPCKLKGIPVKLKVPSHVGVTIYEQQVLLTKADSKKYKLVSFAPAQLMVDTETIYTDKVFLVDFRRPAGGILDLKEAKLDDEQYFAKIQAEVTERTINDINTALQTLQPAVTQFKQPPKAKATTANTPAASTDNVGFQKSVVAYHRFDISEPDWEYRLQDFVNLHLARCEVICTEVAAASIKGPAISTAPRP